MPRPKPLTDDEYAKLLAFRARLRRFLRQSDQRAAQVGLTTAQHQLLLAVRGHLDTRGPTIGEVADYLCTRHHSAVQLIDRAEQLGLVIRVQSDDSDRRIRRIRLTVEGEEKLALLSRANLDELRGIVPLMDALVDEQTSSRSSEA